MCRALQEIDGNRRFRGIIHAERNAYSLNPRLIDQTGDVGFLHHGCVIDLFFRKRWKCLGRLVIEDQARTYAVNRRRDSWDGAAGDMYQQSAFAWVVSTRSHRHGLDGRILKQLSGAALLDRGNALALLRDQCRLRSPYLQRTGSSRMGAANRVVWTTHNGKRR